MNDKTFFDKELIGGAVGAAGKNLRRAITIFSFIALVSLNVLTLASSKMHDLLYAALSSIPISGMTDFLANSPTEKKKKLKSKLAKEKIKTNKIKTKTKRIAGNVKKRVAKTAGANVTAAFGESIPFYGIAIIASSTAYELWSACETSKDMDSLLSEIELSGQSNETTKVCGMQPPSKETLVSSIDVTKERYGDLQNEFGAFLYDFKSESDDKWKNFQDALGGTIYEILN